jgi:hypothetical protein
MQPVSVSGPLDLDVARREFERWRRSRPRGERIPVALWRTAVDLARRHGTSKTSQVLHLDYYALQRRLTGTEPATAIAGTEFVDVALPADARGSRCQLEIGDDGGGKLRVDVCGLSAKDLATFVRAVAGRES